MTDLVLPRVQAMIVCDDAIETAEDGVFDLTSVRTVITAAVFLTVNSFVVFAQLSGHQGEAFCNVRLESYESGELIDDTEPQSVVFEDPTITMPMSFRVINCVFPSPGVYFVQVHCARKLIGERRLHLEEE
jgi:hypothetical protein